MIDQPLMNSNYIVSQDWHYSDEIAVISMVVDSYIQQ
jgi:hypothetical protein